MAIRGIRGAIRIPSNTRKAIHDGTRRLVRAVMRANRVKAKDVASCMFTMTPDLFADFPAYATRGMKDWKHVPILCAQELSVPGMMDRVVRIMLLVNTETAQDRIQHQYLGDSLCLRPDLARKTRKKARRK